MSGNHLFMPVLEFGCYEERVQSIYDITGSVLLIQAPTNAMHSKARLAVAGLGCVSFSIDMHNLEDHMV